MYKLYWAPMAGSIVPEALFEEIGADYEKILVHMEEDALREPDYLAVNPMGQVPALLLPDGTLMTESAAIVLHITDRHPEAKLAPPLGSSESAIFQRWLIFMATTVYPAATRFYYSERFTNDANGSDGVKASALADFDRLFGILNDELEAGPYFLGQTFSAVDIYLAMFAVWHPEPERLFEERPRIKQLVDLVLARPAVARVWAENSKECDWWPLAGKVDRG